MPRVAKKRNHRVCLLAYDGLSLFEFSVATEVFGLARPEFSAWYDFSVAALESGPLRATGGITIQAAGGLGRLRAADTIIIPGWGVDRQMTAELAGALRRAHGRGTRLVTFCSGAFALAEAGLLAGRRAATHWRYAEAMRGRYPDIEVDESVLYVDEDSILTSAGSAAAIDLSLYLVRKDFGAEIANEVARRMVTTPHRDGGQAQFIKASVDADEGESPIVSAMNWARKHLRSELSVSVLAKKAKMSERSFARHFREVTGTTPADWVNRERVLFAQTLLEKGTLSMDDVASRAGFGSTPTFRHHFARKVGVPPTRYRAEFSRSTR